MTTHDAKTLVPQVMRELVAQKAGEGDPVAGMMEQSEGGAGMGTALSPTGARWPTPTGTWSSATTVSGDDAMTTTQALQHATDEQAAALQASDAAADALDDAERALEKGEAEAIRVACATVEEAEDDHDDAKQAALEAREMCEEAAESSTCPLCGQFIGASAFRLLADAAKAADHEAAESQVDLSAARVAADRVLAATVAPLLKARDEARAAFEDAAARNRTAISNYNAAWTAVEREESP